MNRIERTWLFLSAALAAGEGFAMACSWAAEFWPLFLVLSVLVAFFGYGASGRFWPYAALALVGVSLVLHASVSHWRGAREAPWRRTVERHERVPMAISPIRDELSRRVGLGLEHESDVVNLNRAILLGERSRLPYALKRAFLESGSIHIFAISGLHIMAIVRLLMFVLAVFGVPARVQGVFALPICWLYVALIGFPPSAVRALMMACVCVLAPVLWRKPNLLIAWALTFLVVHLIHPDQITNTGSLFSFTVMLVLCFALRFGRMIANPFAALVFYTLMAWAAGVPIAAVIFGRFTPGGILANLILVALVIQTVIAGAIGLVVSFVCEPLAAYFNQFAAIITKGMVVVAEGVSQIPGAMIDIPRWGFAECVLWYSALGLVFYLLDHIRKRREMV